MEKVKAEVERVEEYMKGDWSIRMFTTLKTGKKRFVGVSMMCQTMHTPQGVVNRDVPVMFDIVANSIEGAFKCFDDSQKSKLKELQEKAEIPKIIRARGAGGNGKQLKVL